MVGYLFRKMLRGYAPKEPHTSCRGSGYCDDGVRRILGDVDRGGPAGRFKDYFFEKAISATRLRRCRKHRPRP